jgi:hypothetical protein
VELSNFDKYRSVVSKGFEKNDIVFTESPVFLVEELDGTQSLSIPFIEGHTEYAACPIPGLSVHFLVELRMSIGILDIQGFSGLKAVSGHSASRGDSDDLLSHAKGYCRPKFILVCIMEEKATTVRLHHFRGLLGNLEKHIMELQIQANEPAQFEERMEFSPPFFQRVFLSPVFSSADCLPSVAFSSVLHHGSKS